MIQDLWIHRRYIVVNGINGLSGTLSRHRTWIGLDFFASPRFNRHLFGSFLKVMPVQRVGTGPLDNVLCAVFDFRTSSLDGLL